MKSNNDSQSSPESYAQWGDDRLVLDYFRGREGCTFLEAGANDPIALSLTYLLEQNGWTGVLVEPFILSILFTSTHESFKHGLLWNL